jgi:hypothetical protein
MCLIHYFYASEDPSIRRRGPGEDTLAGRISGHHLASIWSLQPLEFRGCCQLISALPKIIDKWIQFTGPDLPALFPSHTWHLKWAWRELIIISLEARYVIATDIFFFSPSLLSRTSVISDVKSDPQGKYSNSPEKPIKENKALIYLVVHTTRTCI